MPNASSHPLTVIAVDPGETTGWAIWRHGAWFGAGTLRLDRPADFWRWAEIAIRSMPDALVVERWMINAASARRLAGSTCPAAEAIGMIRGVIHGQGWPAITLVEPSTKPLGLAAIRKGWIPHPPTIKGGGQHTKDAYALAAAYLVSHPTNGAPL